MVCQCAHSTPMSSLELINLVASILKKRMGIVRSRKENWRMSHFVNEQIVSLLTSSFLATMKMNIVKGMFT